MRLATPNTIDARPILAMRRYYDSFMHGLSATRSRLPLRLMRRAAAAATIGKEI